MKNQNTESMKDNQALGKPPAMDQNLKIYVEKQGTSVWVEVLNTGKDPVSLLSELKLILRQKGVVHGIYRDSVLKTRITGQANFFAVARATVFLDISACTENRFLDKGDDQGRIKQGDPLAHIELKESRGKEDLIKLKDVYGRMITPDLPDTKILPFFRCGTGARIARNSLKVFAGRRGIPYISKEGRFYVFSIVNVLGDADLKFGRIDPFSNMVISGILSGVYPVTAGSIKAKEIRGAEIESVNDIRVDIGITDSRIRTQGSVFAKYLHNVTIEAFGDVVVDHEILDSRIIISGKCTSLKSKIMASEISAASGITACGVGSDRAQPSVLRTGRMDHFLLEDQRITDAALLIEQKLKNLEKNKKDQTNRIEKIFKEMQNLKCLHDRLTDKKEKIQLTLEQENLASQKELHHRIIDRLADIERKIETIIVSLKDLNRKKQARTRKLEKIRKTIKTVKPGIEKHLMELEMDRTALHHSAENTGNLPEIIIKGQVADGTIVKGIFSSITSKKGYENVKIFESKVRSAPDRFEINVEKL
ncbi:MAG: FapA family protein [Thermodesulfobacteriota bacterium]|nr:FapA family protein [Thermodesulfobacteriota bacterium]